MGTLHVALCGLNVRDQINMNIPAVRSQPTSANTLTTTTSAARVGTLAATAEFQVWLVTAVDEAMYVRFSSDAAANAAGPDYGHAIAAGSTVAFDVTAVGEQVSARDIA